MPSLINEIIVMTGAAGVKDVLIPKITPEVRFLNMVNMTDNTLYLCPPTAQGRDESITVFGPYATLSIPIYPDIAFSFRIFWTASADFGLIKKAQLTFTYDSLNYNQCYADSFAFAAGKLGITVENTPQVEATVKGTADVNIMGTPQVDITGQTVVANVSNASFDVDVINGSNSPANFIFGQGSYDTANYVGINPPGGGETTPLLVAGNYVKKVRLSVENTAGTQGVYVITNGANQFYTEPNQPANSVRQIDLDLGGGIYNGGIKIKNTGVGALSVNGVIITSAQTPNSKVATIV